jgi:hypothetical protein
MRERRSHYQDDSWEVALTIYAPEPTDEEYMVEKTDISLTFWTSFKTAREENAVCISNTITNNLVHHASVHMSS